jgi:hypothetical protein
MLQRPVSLGAKHADKRIYRDAVRKNGSLEEDSISCVLDGKIFSVQIGQARIYPATARPSM